jgi:hypothetical protein
MAEELRRFRGDAPPSPDTLSHAYASRDALVRAFVAAVVSGDTATLARLHVTRSEFGDLYFPSSRFTHPPYELPPALLWFQITAESNKGITKLMRTFTNTDPIFVRVECSATPVEEGKNLLWENCSTFLRNADGEIKAWRLFGSILERNGRMKFLSYANEL